MFYGKLLASLLALAGTLYAGVNITDAIVPEATGIVGYQSVEEVLKQAEILTTLGETPQNALEMVVNDTEMPYIRVTEYGRVQLLISETMYCGLLTETPGHYIIDQCDNL